MTTATTPTSQPWAPTCPAGVMRHPGTNGWLSSWGTNAHGEIAGCPPGPHRS
ncbi:hypothetical protein ACQP2P_22290 [Dactylosporangium sp. CA-139114]|uniref:hypothetical protein n=1 Tax=Dactylosporangium sp. CA-139114 TaxID=3239931 RepID=UPI003D960466